MFEHFLSDVCGLTHFLCWGGTFQTCILTRVTCMFLFIFHVSAHVSARKSKTVNIGLGLTQPELDQESQMSF